MRKILYIVGSDGDGNLIKARDAEKGNEFFCTVCKTELILRKSGRTGPGSKRPHFAHRTLTPNCTPETALHYSFKTLLSQKILEHISLNRTLQFYWQCGHCYDEHSGNLIKRAKKVAVEYNMTVCQPDIALLDESGNVFAVVEVVVTHRPDDNALKFYKDNNIALIQFDLESDMDLDDLELKISRPDLVSICRNPKCERCGHYQHKTKMSIIEAECWRCHSVMKLAVIEEPYDRGSSIGPSQFFKGEIEIARQNGVNIKEQFSGTVSRRYQANSCPKCPGFIGEHYLFTEYHAPAGYGELKSYSFDIGYYCGVCWTR